MPKYQVKMEDDQQKKIRKLEEKARVTDAVCESEKYSGTSNQATTENLRRASNKASCALWDYVHEAAFENAQTDKVNFNGGVTSISYCTFLLVFIINTEHLGG